MVIASPAVGDPATAAWADQVAAGVNAFVTPPYLFAVGVNSQVVTGATNIALVVSVDTVGGWDATNHRWTCPASGSTWLISGQVRCGSSAAPTAQLYINGSLAHNGPTPPAATAAGSSVTVVRNLNSGDTMSLQSFAGFTMSGTNGAQDTFLSIVQL